MTPITPTPIDEASITAALRDGPHRMLDVGHSRLASWTFGTGPDLVLIHGWPLHAATYRRVVARLADAFTCHVFDLPGTGHTATGPGAPIDLLSHGATARAAIDRLGLTRYALLGHDSGGFVARVVAADDARCRGLVLVDTEIPGHVPRLVVLLAVLARLPGGIAMLRTGFGSRALRRSSLGFGGCFSDPDYLDGDFHELFIAPLLRSRQVAASQLALLSSLTRSQFAKLPALHASIRCPVQLIWGTDDPFFPLAKARAMIGQFPGDVRFDEIPQGRLFVQEDHPDELAALARPFVRSCLAARHETVA